MLKWLVFLGALAFAGAAFAADAPQYGPPAAWVLDAPVPTPPSAEGAPEDQLLLHDDQFMADAAGDHWYHRAVYKVLGSGALATAGARSITWDPAHDTLVIHHVLIRRGDQVIDALADGKGFLVLRRETSLERAMLDGRLTATKQIEGLQVGDIVDYAYTVTSHDPVLKGYAEWVTGIAHQGVAGRIRLRAVWPSGRPIRWRAADGLGQPTIAQHGPNTELLIDLTDVAAPQPPVGAPGRFKNIGILRLTEFADWAEVSALMAPLYANSEIMAPASPVRAEAAKIKAASADPKVRAGMALALVEDQIRYLALTMGEGGYVPANVDDTWSRRFGDCKAKTVLLIALLHELGIEAEPALVNTGNGDGLDGRLPQLDFDHVIVRATIAGRAYWLDGTRVGDHQGIDALRVPSWRWALPVRDHGAVLEQLIQSPLTEPETFALLKLDASAGLDAPAPAHFEETMRGDAAIVQRQRVQLRSRADNERLLKAAISKQFPWIQVNSVDWSADEATGAFHFAGDGTATIDWRRNRDVGAREFAASAFGANFIPKRQPGPHQDAPFAVPFPTYAAFNTEITLPNHGDGFSIVGSDVSETIGGVEIRRRSRIENGVALMETSSRSVMEEFPAAQADAANKLIQDLIDDPVTLRAPKG